MRQDYYLCRPIIFSEMAKNDKKKRNWRDKYRFAVINDHTFEEVWRIRLTQYNAFFLITFLILFLIGAQLL